MDNYSNREFYNSTSTAVEEDFDKKIVSRVQPEKKSNFNFETDDYSVNSNFKEETGYDIKSKVQSFSEHENETFSFFKPITIERAKYKDQEQVALTKTIEKFHVGGRVKLVLSSFVVVMLSLMVAIVWNFAQLAKLNTSMSEKEVAINELQNSITNLNEEYKLLDSEEKTKQVAEASGYVERTEANSKVVSLGEMYTEAKPAEVSSNWFNDVCNFLTHVFN